MSSSKKSGSCRHGLIWRVMVALLATLLIAAAATFLIYQCTIASTRDDVRSVAQIEEQGIKMDAVLVLGASVYADGTPSDMLADRLEVASDLYFAGAAPRIIVSGAKSQNYDEPGAMKRYCMDLGVPESAITMDPEGDDTYASVYRAKSVYGVERVLVVTQAYHLYRSLMIAHLLGFEDAKGVAADKGAYNNQVQYSLRELVSRDIDFFMALFKIPA